MIRRDREIVDRAAQLAIVDACDVCRVCLNGADGYPYVVPLNFGVEVAGDDVTLSRFMGNYQNYQVMVGDTLVKITDFNPKNHKSA